MRVFISVPARICVIEPRHNEIGSWWWRRFVAIAESLAGLGARPSRRYFTQVKTAVIKSDLSFVMMMIVGHKKAKQNLSGNFRLFCEGAENWKDFQTFMKRRRFSTVIETYRTIWSAASIRSKLETVVAHYRCLSDLIILFRALEQSAAGAHVFVFSPPSLKKKTTTSGSICSSSSDVSDFAWEPNRVLFFDHQTSLLKLCFFPRQKTPTVCESRQMILKHATCCHRVKHENHLAIVRFA